MRHLGTDDDSNTGSTPDSTRGGALISGSEGSAAGAGTATVSDASEGTTGALSAPGRGGMPRAVRRRAMVWAAAIVVIVAAAGGTWAATRDPASGTSDGTRYTGATAAVARGDLQGTTSVSGTLKYAGSRTVSAGRGGTVTAIPMAGRTVKFDQQLYAVDNAPTFLLPGRLPAWREFDATMSDGPDIEQLERALDDLGFFDGDVDHEFTYYTAEAIRDWQESKGLERTGTLPLGSVVFSPEEVRVASTAAEVGDLVAPGAPVLTASRTSKIVEIQVKLADQQLAMVNGTVDVRLPGGAATRGTIVSVGTPAEVDAGSGQKQTVIPVTIRLNKPRAAADFQEASVTVELPSQERKDVLMVPIGALVALTPDRYAVEVVNADGTTTKVPVRTGLFAAGQVEVAGDLEPGQNVVVPQR